MYILNISIAITSYDDASARILQWTTNSVSRYVCVSNVHMCMEAFDNHDFCHVVNNADLVVPDGLPLLWALKSLGAKHASHVRGSELLLRLCGEAQKRNVSIGLYGGTQDSLDDFLKFLKEEFPDLRIPFFSAPPFRELTQEERA